MKKRRRLKRKVKIIFLIIILGIFVWLNYLDNFKTIGKFFGEVKDFTSVVNEKGKELFNQEELARQIELIKLRALFKEDENYASESILVYDIKNKDIIFSKEENKIIVPASLTKLFVIDYALTFTNPEDIVNVTKKVLYMPKKNSSSARLTVGNYTVNDLIKGMLVPSGNDASYALAEYCGNILDSNSLDKQKEFLESLNKYLLESGYQDTVINDPSGYDLETKTSSKDLLKLNLKLLNYDWFKDIVSKETYSIITPDNKKLTWKNTNQFLNEDSEHYNPNVFGIKTGGLKGHYNLVNLTKIKQKEYLIITLEAFTEEERTEDNKKIIEKLDY